MGPVTKTEYESRAERYDQQLRELVGVDPQNLATAEKMSHLRKYRQDQYELLLDAVYKRRGWDENSIPSIEKIKDLGLDLPILLDEIRKAQRLI
jgi:aldehyde:ferredoxin oxidoreductase